jgi:hypothetical protein
MASTQGTASAFLLPVTPQDILELLKLAGQGCGLLAWFVVTLLGTVAWPNRQFLSIERLHFKRML